MHAILPFICASGPRVLAASPSRAAREAVRASLASVSSFMSMTHHSNLQREHCRGLLAAAVLLTASLACKLSAECVRIARHERSPTAEAIAGVCHPGRVADWLPVRQIIRLLPHVGDGLGVVDRSGLQLARVE